MKILLLFIIYFLILLIKIGDFVVFIFNSVFKVINKKFYSISRTVRNFQEKYNVFKKDLEKKQKNLLKKLRKKIIIFGYKFKINKNKTIFIAPKNIKNTPEKKILPDIRFYIYKVINTGIKCIVFPVKKTFLGFFSVFLKPVYFLIKIRKILYLKRFFYIRPKLFQINRSKREDLKKKKIVKTKGSFALSFIIKFKYFIFGIIFSSLFIFIPLLFLIFLQDLPSPKELVLRQIPQTTKIYDRNGILLYQIYAQQNRTIVPLADIPKNLKDATIAIEDKDFYKHPGFDISAIVRSAVNNISGEEIQGGSTITQQLIKSALLTPETNMTRKIKEVILAFWTERIYNKNQIIEMYFNQVPYGGTAWGIEAASETYFGKKAKDLSLAESAFLAGIPKAPTIYSPFGTNPILWKKRQKEVLKKMTELGYITKDQSNTSENENLTFQTPQTPLHAPHFVMHIKDMLVKKYGLPMVEKGGLTVTTSLDLKLQDFAQKVVTEEVNNNARLNLTNGAVLITSPSNGDILAMVGSKDFSDPKDGNVNLTTSFRQPGSSIKVITYSAALSKGFTAASIIDDSPVTFPDGQNSYSPVNYDGRFHGKVPLRVALANSFNIPAVKVLNQIGVPEMVNLGKKMGIKSWGDPEKYGLSITLGAAETSMTDMATVYGTLSNGGVSVDLNPFIKVSDYKGNILEEKIPPDKEPAKNMFDAVHANEKNLNFFSISNTGRRVLDAGIAFIISSILSDNNARALEFGINSPLNIPGYNVSVKTGTSDNKRDNWTIGYTISNTASIQNYLVAVWVGNNDNSPMSQTLASGITGAAPIWNKIMTSLLNGKQNSKPVIPLDIVQKQCLGRNEYFIKGTENSVSCNYIPSIPPSPTVR